VRSVLPREIADKLRMMATEENCTLSDMIALLLKRAVEEK
jgi:CopG-like RHH_1 or ribbon-helix-helix domain, RHH_5